MNMKHITYLYISVLCLSMMVWGMQKPGSHGHEGSAEYPVRLHVYQNSGVSYVSSTPPKYVDQQTDYEIAIMAQQYRNRVIQDPKKLGEFLYFFLDPHASFDQACDVIYNQKHVRN